MSEIIRLTRQGTPARLAENILDLADDLRFMLVVMVETDGTIHTEWSALQSNLEALGAVEVLKQAVMQEGDLV